jgi:hypothetical protein
LWAGAEIVSENGFDARRCESRSQAVENDIERLVIEGAQQGSPQEMVLARAELESKRMIELGAASDHGYHPGPRLRAASDERIEDVAPFRCDR